MPDLYLPTKVRLRYCTIKGWDMHQHIKNIQVFYSMCKPYATAKFMLVDNTGLINGLEISALDEVDFAFDGGEFIHEGVQYVLTISGEESTKNNRTQMFTISTASASFFKNKASLVQRADSDIPATDVAAAIHSEYVGGDKGLSVDVSSSGIVAIGETGGGYVTNNKKPFTAIMDVLERCPFGGYPEGCAMYFLSYDAYHMGPLKYYFDSMGSQAEFTEIATLGKNLPEQFTSWNNIIAARVVKNETADVAARAGGGDLASVASQAMNMFDIGQGFPVIQSLASGGGQFGGKGGGIQNVLQTDFRKLPLSADQGINAIAEHEYQMRVYAATNYLIKVPIQGGIVVTCGQGITAAILGPKFDDDADPPIVGGLLLVADVMHDCWFDDRPMQATTTMRAVETPT